MDVGVVSLLCFFIFVNGSGSFLVFVVNGILNVGNDGVIEC